VIIIYLAVAGACAEDKANAGGGGTPPAGGVTLNQVYFSDSAVSGANAGIVPNIFRNAGFLGFGVGSQPFPTISMTGTSITGLSSPTVTQIAADEVQSDYTIPTATWIAFLDSAFNAAITDPFTGKTRNEQIFFNIGTFLQTPNGVSNINFFRLVSASTNMTGIITFVPPEITIAANYPLVNSLAISTTYPFAENSVFQGTSGDFGILGTGLLTGYSQFNPPPNGQTQTLIMANVIDVRAKLGQNPTAGQTYTVEYQVSINNTAGQLEKTTHRVVLTLA
tara:strand:- start:7959 stop:8795 length:837 start_codon:yes stop_codon:yes gene_type:complete